MTLQLDSPNPPWLDIAFSQHGIREIPGPRAHPQIVAYHATTSLRSSSDEVPWCSAFANWCMAGAHFRGTGSAAARSWLEWGDPLERPQLGCVVVLQAPTRGPRAGHVAFHFMERTSKQLWLYGGNHGNEVGLRSYPRADVIGYRWPANSDRLPLAR